jgi:hypothetical protein
MVGMLRKTLMSKFVIEVKVVKPSPETYCFDSFEVFGFGFTIVENSRDFILFLISDVHF